MCLSARILLFIPLACGLVCADPVPILFLQVSNNGANQTTELDIQDVSGTTACDPGNFPSPTTVCNDLSLLTGSVNVTFADSTTVTKTLGASLPLSGDAFPSEFIFPFNPLITALSFTGTISATDLTLFNGSSLTVSPVISAVLDLSGSPGFGGVLVFASPPSAVPEPKGLGISLALLCMVLIMVRRCRRDHRAELTRG